MQHFPMLQNQNSKDCSAGHVVLSVQKYGINTRVVKKETILLIILFKIFSSPIHSPEEKKLTHSHAVYFPRLTAFTLILNFSTDLKCL